MIEDTRQPPEEYWRPRSLREAREAIGDSLRSMARQLGVSPTFLSMIETGKQRIPTDRIAEFEEAYDVEFIKPLTIRDWEKYAELLEAALGECLKHAVVEDYDPITNSGPSVLFKTAPLPITGSLFNYLFYDCNIREQTGWLDLPGGGDR